ncbi:toxin-antitoxin system HicB family antitoxin [Candidatus Poribacteria bacterium]|nr:MAG: toxin-antitoxin system HicB family antitoxin [Candidatus Poribacteria bacterium]
MKTMTYKGYTAEIIYNDEDECFVGHVVNIGDDIIGFHGDTDEELRVAFEDVVDLHIKVKEQPENPPQKHFAGRLLSRLRQALNL